MPAQAHPRPGIARVLSLGRCRNLFRLLFGVAVCLVSAVSLWAQVIGPLKEVKPALWAGVREDGLHFVMERIDAGVEHSESRRAFWNAFCEEEFRAERDYRAFFEKADASMKARLPLKYDSENHCCPVP